MYLRNLDTEWGSFLSTLYPKTRIFNRLRRLGIDSKESISPAYEAWRAGTSNRVFLRTRQGWESIPGLLKDLQIRALWDFFTGNNLFQAEQVSHHLRKLFPSVGSIK